MVINANEGKQFNSPKVKVKVIHSSQTTNRDYSNQASQLRAPKFHTSTYQDIHSAERQLDRDETPKHYEEVA